MKENKYTRLEDGPDGSIRAVKNTPDRGYLGGGLLRTEGEASDEEIAMMKEALVEGMCKEIRQLAKEREDFFIIKKGANFPGLDDTIVTTVGVKFILPTVRDHHD